MTKDDIIRMAREAGLHSAVLLHIYGKEAALCDSEIEELRQIKVFANLVAAHKAEVITAEAYRCGYKDGMEAAAVICENVDKSTHPADLADAIRARGNT